MSTAKRKRRGGAVNSRQARKRNRLMSSTAEMASEAVPIELEESAPEEEVDHTCESSDLVVIDLTPDDSVVIVEAPEEEVDHTCESSDLEVIDLTPDDSVVIVEAGEEVIDLTSEPSDPVVIDLTDNDSVVIVEAGEEVIDLTSEPSDPVVVDLTHNDSVVIVEENQQQSRNLGLIVQQHLSICILISTDEDEPRSNDTPSGTVSCPICMDGYSEIVQSGRLIVSTECGHVFCSQCLRDSLRNANSCPNCRKELTHRQYHPIYI